MKNEIPISFTHSEITTLGMAITFACENLDIFKSRMRIATNNVHAPFQGHSNTGKMLADISKKLMIGLIETL